METKPLDAISVADICSTAGVSKKTFYNHFQSKQDIVTAVLERDFFLPQRRIRKSLFPEQLKESSDMLVQLTYDTFFKKRDFYLMLIEGIGKSAFFDLFAKLSQELNSEVYAPTSQMNDLSRAELDYMCMFLATTSARSLQWWMERGFSPSPHEVAKLYRRWGLYRIQSEENPYVEMCDSTARNV